MRFVVIYPNRENIRANIEREIIILIKQRSIDFSVHSVNTPFFNSRPLWPPIGEINSLPFNMQCEEFSWDGEKLTSIRKLVTDVEVISQSKEEVS